ncbi:hypothetical protein B0J12DRAFT_272425 [Macrophomina phaseolina]|uniref:Uncharacterized protein n=1 Tax=Macrophomina phaseolina TaxID=35725 RepID=A0ABQ8FXV0_9PEZI|nr:hypothetical protein B0J12DRAFT_272425 [Macrophomina phaseolina]
MVAAVEGWSAVGEMEKEKNDDLLASDPHMVLFSHLVFRRLGGADDFCHARLSILPLYWVKTPRILLTCSEANGLGGRLIKSPGVLSLSPPWRSAAAFKSRRKHDSAGMSGLKAYCQKILTEEQRRRMRGDRRLVPRPCVSPDQHPTPAYLQNAEILLTRTPSPTLPPSGRLLIRTYSPAAILSSSTGPETRHGPSPPPPPQ